MRKLFCLLNVLLVLSICLASCVSEETASNSTIEEGKLLFSQSVIDNQTGCINCHSLIKDVVIVGPSMAGIGSRSDSNHIRESILDPDASLAEGFPAGTMPDVWKEKLTGEQVDQLVAYLLTLK